MSQRLRIPVVDLMRWIQGESKPPKGVFLQLVDFVIEESGRRGLASVRGARKPGKPKGTGP